MPARVRRRGGPCVRRVCACVFGAPGGPADEGEGGRLHVDDRCARRAARACCLRNSDIRGCIFVIVRAHGRWSRAARAVTEEPPAGKSDKVLAIYLTKARACICVDTRALANAFVFLWLCALQENQMEWWKHVAVGEPDLNTRKVQPENSKLGDLDADTRTTVEKMMVRRRRRRRGWGYHRVCVPARSTTNVRRRSANPRATRSRSRGCSRSSWTRTLRWTSPRRVPRACRARVCVTPAAQAKFS